MLYFNRSTLNHCSSQSIYISFSLCLFHKRIRLYFKTLFSCSQTLISKHENHSRKRPVPVTNTFSAFRGCPLTRTSTLLTDIIFLSWNDQFSAANWCQHWFEFFPNPPVNILGMVENLLVHHDKRIMQHFVSCNVTSQVSPLLKGVLNWHVESIKSLGRVLTKISDCQVNTTSRQGIKQLRISFGSIFLLFSYESSRGPRS